MQNLFFVYSAEIQSAILASFFCLLSLPLHLHISPLTLAFRHLINLSVPLTQQQPPAHINRKKKYIQLPHHQHTHTHSQTHLSHQPFSSSPILIPALYLSTLSLWDFFAACASQRISTLLSTQLRPTLKNPNSKSPRSSLASPVKEAVLFVVVVVVCYLFCTMIIAIQSEGYTCFPMRSLKSRKDSIRKSCSRREKVSEQ